MTLKDYLAARHDMASPRWTWPRWSRTRAAARGSVAPGGQAGELQVEKGSRCRATTTRSSTCSSTCCTTHWRRRRPTARSAAAPPAIAAPRRSSSTTAGRACRRARRSASSLLHHQEERHRPGLRCARRSPRHGGVVTIANREGGGCRATVILPGSKARSEPAYEHQTRRRGPAGHVQRRWSSTTRNCTPWRCGASSRARASPATSPTPAARRCTRSRPRSTSDPAGPPPARRRRTAPDSLLLARQHGAALVMMTRTRPSQRGRGDPPGGRRLPRQGAEPAAAGGAGAGAEAARLRCGARPPARKSRRASCWGARRRWPRWANSWRRSPGRRTPRW